MTEKSKPLMKFKDVANLNGMFGAIIGITNEMLKMDLNDTQRSEIEMFQKVVAAYRNGIVQNDYQDSFLEIRKQLEEKE